MQDENRDSKSGIFCRERVFDFVRERSKVFCRCGQSDIPDNKPVEGAGALFQERFKGAADVAFVVEFAAPEFLQRLVICFDGRVGWLQLEVAHECKSRVNGESGVGFSRLMPLSQG